MRSLLALHWLLQAQFTAGRDDGQVIVHVMANEVTNAVKAMILRPDLGGGEEQLRKLDRREMERWQGSRACGQP